jgi:hypothetical protein
MGTDSSIIYAFIATVIGALISVSAGLIAAIKSKGSATNVPIAVAKPQHAIVRRTLVYHTKTETIPSLDKYRSNLGYALNVEERVVVHIHKPTGRVAFLPIDSKDRAFYRRLNPICA